MPDASTIEAIEALRESVASIILEQERESARVGKEKTGEARKHLSRADEKIARIKTIGPDAS